jgi:hypothetical protein
MAIESKAHMPLGNKLGWILSGVLVLVLAVVVVVMSMNSSEESPTTLAITKPGFFEAHDVKMSPAPLLGGVEQSAPGDAAEDYRKAMAFYAENKSSIADVMDRWKEVQDGSYTIPDSVMATLQKIYEIVAAGAAKKEMHYSTPEMVQVRASYDPAIKLYWLAKDGPLDFLVQIYFHRKQYDQMEKVLRAELGLGLHMTREHVRALMGTMGWDIVNRVIATMQGLYGTWEPEKHGDLLKAAEDYGLAANKVSNDYANKLRVVWKATPEPGDVFAVVKRDQDRAWRIEGLLVCGVVRITHNKRGREADLKQADKVIAQYINDPDPFLKAAAKAAAAMTPEEFKLVGTPPGQ